MSLAVYSIVPELVSVAEVNQGQQIEITAAMIAYSQMRKMVVSVP